MSKPCEYCGVDLPLGVDKKTRRMRSFHFASCKNRPQPQPLPALYDDDEARPLPSESDRAARDWAAVYTGVDSVETFEPGSRVEGGIGEDHDTGRIERIDGDIAFVAWDSGVKTPAPLCILAILP